jgi:peptidase E
LRKPTLLIAGQFGSRHFGTKPFLADALKLIDNKQPRALYVGAASGDNADFGAALTNLLEAAGAHRVLWPKLARRRPQSAAARAALHEADLVFIGGGDVEAGMKVLQDAELVADFRAGAERGVMFAGMSAGAIMLGERWIRWPRADAGDDEAETYECLAIAPCSLDTHGEGDGWRETQSFAAVRARELGKKARVYAVPSGGALLARDGGALEPKGAAISVFAAQPMRKAKVEQTLTVAR